MKNSKKDCMCVRNMKNAILKKIIKKKLKAKAEFFDYEIIIEKKVP